MKIELNSEEVVALYRALGSRFDNERESPPNDSWSELFDLYCRLSSTIVEAIETVDRAADRDKDKLDAWLKEQSIKIDEINEKTKVEVGSDPDFFVPVRKEKARARANKK